jgi:nondiscriminating aspartyl-tRNA synthetase
MERTLTIDTPNFIGKKVTLAGWVNVRRDHGKIIFIDLRDRTGIIQVVFAPNKKNPELQKSAETLRNEYVVEITGIVNERPKNMINEKISTGKVELLAEEVVILNSAESLPIDLGAEKLDMGLETLLDMRPLTLKHPRVRAIFKVQAEIIKAFHEFFSEKGFTEIQTPKIVAEATEGGSEVFPIEYFESKAYLAQSPQFYKQIMVGVFERVFTIGNVYRAEPHDTTRHINEYTSLDLEMGFIKDYTELMRLETEWLKYLISELEKKCTAEFELLGAKLPETPETIPVIPFPEAKKITEKITGKKTDPMDLEPEEERVLVEYAAKELKSEFLFVTHYPTKKRPWYTMPDDKDANYTKSFDLLFRGVEITTGGQRINNYDQLVQSIKNRGIDSDKFKFYLMAFQYGMPPEGGLAIGLERLTAKLLGLANVKEATLFPRDMKRIDLLLHKEKIIKNGEDKKK